jgi:hypothetical protein
MATEDDLQDALLAIHSRLGLIEGKVNVVARADRDRIMTVTEETVRKQPSIGQIYLLLDGNRAQKEIHEALLANGIKISQPTVSRRMAEMETEHGMVELVRRGVYRRDHGMEKVLNLSKNIRRWLGADGNIVPE